MRVQNYSIFFKWPNFLGVFFSGGGFRGGYIYGLLTKFVFLCLQMMTQSVKLSSVIVRFTHKLHPLPCNVIFHFPLSSTAISMARYRKSPSMQVSHAPTATVSSAAEAASIATTARLVRDSPQRSATSPDRWRRGNVSSCGNIQR